MSEILKDRLYLLVEATKQAIKEIDNEEEKEILRGHLEYIYYVIK